jgi:hypothetical protein
VETGKSGEVVGTVKTDKTGKIVKTVKDGRMVHG